MKSSPRTLILIATYNEVENLPRLVGEIRGVAPQCDFLVVDDNSPDGTGQWCAQQAAADQRFHVLHRPGKLGLGTALIAGLQYAEQNGYEWVLNMDADFSHHPRHLPELLGLAWDTAGPAADVVIGSRYTRGGRVEGWPLRRRVMSRLVNWYARGLLSLSVRDCSGAFRCYRTAALRQVDLAACRSRGYAFLEELLWHLQRSGARLVETPIVFADRRQGLSKINSREAVLALWVILRSGIKNWLGI